MSIIEIFEKVNLTLPIEQRRFFNHFDSTINELRGLYDKFVIPKDAIYQAPTSLSDEVSVLPLYTEAIVDNILFLASGEEARKSEFLRKSNNAYLKYWNDNAKGRRIKRTEW